MTRLHLPRRTFLRGLVGGAAAGLALPTLEAMLNINGTAHADGAPLPKRFGLGFWGCGVRLDHWVPAKTGPGYAPSPELQPFADAGVLDYVSVVSGMNDPFPDVLGHHDGAVSVATGSNERTNAGRSGDGPFVRPSVDQVVADAWKGKTPFGSVAVLVSRRGAASDDQYCVGISQRGNGDYNRGQADPHALFSTLFGSAGAPAGSGGTTGATGTAGTTGGTSTTSATLKKSILDNYLLDAAALKSKLGAADKARLDQYTDGLRDIETRLQASPPMKGGGCTVPAAPPNTGLEDLGHEDFEGRGQLLYGVLAAALSCDLTRVFALEFSPMQAMAIFWNLPAPGPSDGYHTISHNDQNFVNTAATFHMKMIATFLKTLKDTPDGAGNLLDSVGMFASSDVAEPDTHSRDSMPFVVAGKAGGGLRGGVHVHGSGESMTQIQLTVMQAVEPSLTSFGYNQGQTDKTIADLRG